ATRTSTREPARSSSSTLTGSSAERPAPGSLNGRISKRRGTKMTIVKVIGRWRTWAIAAVTVALVSVGAAADEKGEWTMTGRTYDLKRLCPLVHITLSYVVTMVPTWTLSNGAYRGR